MTSSGNPIQMDLKTRYVIKGIGKEQTIESKVNIFLDSTGKIAKVEDKWNGKLPESGLANVSRLSDLVNPFWWMKYAEGWAFWTWSWIWYTRPWMVREAPSLWKSGLCSITTCCALRLFVSRRLLTTMLSIVFPPPQRELRSIHDPRPKDRRRGCQAWSPQELDELCTGTKS